MTAGRQQKNTLKIIRLRTIICNYINSNNGVSTKLYDLEVFYERYKFRQVD